MGQGYHFLISSLDDYQFDSDAKGLKLLEIRQHIASLLSPSDGELLQLMYYYYDIQNIISLRASRPESFSDLGNMSGEQVELIVSYMGLEKPTDEDEEELPTLPLFIASVVDRYKLSADAEDDDEQKGAKSFEEALLGSYYSYIASKGNKFLKEWYAFDRDLRNVCAAFTARKASLDIQSVVIGSGEVVDALTQSSLPDFGLKGEVDYLDALATAIESSDIVEKERKIDLIRWQMIEDMNTFNYFGSSFLLGYMLQLGILYRWISLDPERGKELFDAMVKGLSDKKLLEESK